MTDRQLYCAMGVWGLMALSTFLVPQTALWEFVLCATAAGIVAWSIHDPDDRDS